MPLKEQLLNANKDFCAPCWDWYLTPQYTRIPRARAVAADRKKDQKEPQRDDLGTDSAAPAPAPSAALPSFPRPTKGYGVHPRDDDDKNKNRAPARGGAPKARSVQGGWKGGEGSGISRDAQRLLKKDALIKVIEEKRVVKESPEGRRR